MRQPETPELRLLLACARAHTTPEDEAAIRRLLSEEFEWKAFVQKAITHGLAGLAGQTLTRVASELVPDDILGAFGAFIEHTRDNNKVLLNELVSLLQHLTAAGVDVIPFKGPVLTQQAFGDLALRGFRDLDLLTRDRDVSRTIQILLESGYERQGKLTDAQFSLIHWLQGQEILFKKDLGAVEPHTRLISAKMALNIDYAGLWERSRPEEIFGHRMLTFSPEDTLLVLAIHGGKELWWDIKWACDVADFIASHPGLDWNAIAKRAKAQGCNRMLLVATALARNYLGCTAIPAVLAAAENGDPAVGEIIDHIVARWEAEDPGGPPSNKTPSRDRLLLHDGIRRQASYVARTLLLPGPEHIPLAALPRWLWFLYIPLGLGHDLLALPIYRACETLGSHFNRLLMISPLALALTPLSANNRIKYKRIQQAYRKARSDLATDPTSCLSWLALGDAHLSMERHKEAIASYDKALAIMPDNRSIWHKRSSVVSMLQKTGNTDFSKAPRFDVKNPDGWALQAGFLSATSRHAEASEASDRALQLDPENQHATRIGIHSRVFACDWSKREADKLAAKMGAQTGRFAIRPFSFKLLSDSEEDCLCATRLWTRSAWWTGKPFWAGERYRHDKIRVAYLSTDYRAHPVGSTIVAPFEHHDKNRFEITAVSLHPGDSGEIRGRIKAAADRFVDAHVMGDGAIATLLRELEIDIAVDLNGHTGAKRHGVLMRRPAPLQVNYLGYPGTMANVFLDYIIADKTVIPEENRAFYTEKVAYLPNAYLPFDRRRLVGEASPSRAEEGLPEKGFVFSSFNSLHKFSPEIFGIWMRLLKTVEGSVLWVPGADAIASASLRREAAAAGVAQERIIFAGYLKNSADHLARQRLADLFLDTLPYNAHSTAADALWVGLPVLTCMGRAFQARVAAGLLHAVGLPEMITTSLEEYEQRALALARDPGQLAAIREKLARNRQTAALFDMARFTRGLEAVYTAMWERQQAGLPPESFSVDDP